MGLYEGIKDVAKVVQQADNVDLYKKLLDLSAQALDMQAEIAALKEENAALKREKEYPYITLASDDKKIRYCGICWGKNRKLIPLYNELNCIVCRQEMRK